MPGPYDHNRHAQGRWDEQDDRGRDDRGRRYGRFMDQEERGSYYGQRGYDEDRYRGPEYESRYGFTSDDDYRGGRNHEGDDNRGMWGREPRGRDRYGDPQRGRGASRFEDDDRSARGERGDHRGWFGDSRRHAAAARRGWRHRQD